MKTYQDCRNCGFEWSTESGGFGECPSCESSNLSVRQEGEAMGERIRVIHHKGHPYCNYTGGDYDFGVDLVKVGEGEWRMEHWTSASNDFDWCTACGEFHEPCGKEHQIVTSYKDVATVSLV